MKYVGFKIEVSVINRGKIKTLNLTLPFCKSNYKLTQEIEKILEQIVKEI